MQLAVQLVHQSDVHFKQQFTSETTTAETDCSAVVVPDGHEVPRTPEQEPPPASPPPASPPAALITE